MKFNTTHTKGGYKILNIIGPDIEGRYGGVVESPDGDFLGCTWGRYGIERDGEEAYYLIQLDEPKPDHKIEARLEALEGRLQTLEACSDETMSILQKELKIVKSRLEALEQRSQPSEKGVWVTTKTFWDACWSQVSVKGEPLEDLFERMAKQLGLEE